MEALYSAPGPPAASLPASLTTFVGREHEVAEAAEVLATARLVTLTGAGGSGKTRLAAEVARAVAGRFADGAAWVELAGITEPSLIAGHIAASLGIGGVGRAPADALRDALRGSELLLVLDNCEHVLDACTALAELLLRECPRLRILATSREALGIPGERALLVPLLSLPAAGDGFDAISHSESVRLFVDRATAASASFVLTDANAEAVARLCRRLDGLPLAIELAAARVRALTPELMLERLDEGLRVLEIRRRAPGSRYRTLREAIDWSYNLLDERERIVLQRLSVFAGEFSLEAAEAVCGAGDVLPEDVLDLVAALVDKSLVGVRDQVDEARYHLLETIRQYGRERLDASGDVDATTARHARFYASLVREAHPHFITPRRPVWVDRIQRELDDVRFALTWTSAHDRATHLELAGQLGWFWYSSGLWTEGRRWLEAALSLPEAQMRDGRRAALLFAAGVIAALQGQGAVARAWLEESSAIAGECGDPALAAYADGYMGVALGQEGLPAAEAPARAALAWFERSGDLYGQRLVLAVLATLLVRQGDLPAARAVAERAVRIARVYGLGRELGIALQVLGTVLLHQRELDAAAATLAEALRALRGDPQPFWLARALELMAVIECARAQPLEAVRLFAAAEARRERMGAALFQLDRERLAPHIAAARAALGEQSFAEAWSSGRAFPFEAAVDLAIANAAPRPKSAASPIAVADANAPASQSRSVLLRVRALGPLEMDWNGVPLPLAAWKHARPRELFVYLLVHPEGRTREQVAAAFWPDASAAQAKNSFHVMLHHLRRALGRPDLVVFANDVYRVNWDLGIEVDVAVFERDVVAACRALRADRGSVHAAHRLREALTRYRGDFLADESAGDWHLELRDRLHRLWVDGLEALGEHLVETRAYDEAADVYRRLVRADELNEHTHRQLMAVLARSGQRNEALRHYDRFASLLERELGSEPEQRTRLLYDRLRRAETV